MHDPSSQNHTMLRTITHGLVASSSLSGKPGEQDPIRPSRALSAESRSESVVRDSQTSLSNQLKQLHEGTLQIIIG